MTALRVVFAWRAAGLLRNTACPCLKVELRDSQRMRGLVIQVFQSRHAAIAGAISTMQLRSVVWIVLMERLSLPKTAQNLPDPAEPLISMRVDTMFGAGGAGEIAWIRSKEIT